VLFAEYPIRDAISLALATISGDRSTPCAFETPQPKKFECKAPNTKPNFEQTLSGYTLHIQCLKDRPRLLRESFLLAFSVPFNALVKVTNNFTRVTRSVRAAFFDIRALLEPIISVRVRF